MMAEIDEIGQLASSSNEFILLHDKKMLIENNLVNLIEHAQKLASAG